MNNKVRVIATLFTAFLLQATFTSAQFKNILKAGGKALDKSPSKLLEKYFNNAPITTSFDHAVTEVDLLGNFDPDEAEAMPLSNLAQNEDGDYIVSEGYYSGYTKSFCMKAGTYGPSKGDGHLYAPLLGPKSALVKKIYQNWQTKAPQIPQTTVQGLIWAIIARTDLHKMDIKYMQALEAMLDKDDISQLAANSLKDKALELGMEKLKGEIPADIYRVFEAERNLRSQFNNANSTYAELERYAVLAGVAPESDMIRPVSKARWSYHPNGFFLRMFPQGYSSTRVEVYLPINVQASTDQLGRISTLTYSDFHKLEFIYDKSGTGNDNLSSSGMVGLKLTDKGIVRDIKLNLPNQKPRFVKNDFSFSKENSEAGVGEFAKWFNAPKGALSLNLNQQNQRTVFNLANLAQFFESVPESALDKELNKHIRYLLNEAYNYSVYKSLSFKADKASRHKNSSNDEINYSGPGINDEYVANATNNSVDFYSQDRGLDLPNNVATPANRSGQRIGQSKDPKKPWYDKLPDCPCTYKEAQKKAQQSGSGWMDCGEANQVYHYGATNEVRWKPDRPGKPGQQCTYDKNGNLITSGVAAGSPDKVSPQGCGPGDGIGYGEIRNFPGHNLNDMRTWENLPCWQYLRDWPANNGNKCAPSNPVNDLQHIKKLVGDMNCRDFTTLLQSANNSKVISDRLRDYLNGKGTMSDQQLINDFKDWGINEDCHGKPLCGAIDKAIDNLQE